MAELRRVSRYCDRHDCRGGESVRCLAGTGAAAGHHASGHPDALIDEERAEFGRAYRQALAEAAETLDLTRVLDVLRSYHRIAWLTQRQGPEAHRRMLDKAAKILRTRQNPDAVPIEDVRALINQRLGR